MKLRGVRQEQCMLGLSAVRVVILGTSNDSGFGARDNWKRDRAVSTIPDELRKAYQACAVQTVNMRPTSFGNPR